MPNEVFWRERFQKLGSHSVGPGDTNNELELEEHRQYFVRGASAWIKQLKGPVLDFGCGVGRWVPDLPRPYLGLDLLSEHLEACRTNYLGSPQVTFDSSLTLETLPDNQFNSIWTCTVLQHIVEAPVRRRIIENLGRVLSPTGIFVSIEWAVGQRQFDWCQAVRKSDFNRFFLSESVGEVVENGRRHTIWVLRKKAARRFLFW
jgi:SAM-dependent methyltransferase